MERGTWNIKVTPERWQQIEEVFQAVVDLTPEARLAYLSEKHGGDAELIAEIKQLISDYEDAEDFIESPVWTDSFMLGATVRDQIGGELDKEIQLDKSTMIGRRLGVYLLTKEIGRGGMGAVYLAERADGEFRQRVALKVIKRGMDTDFIIRRFRNERQILATLDHPNIARLLDGGTTDDGLPYFVMEYIEGSPVYRYSDAKRLTIDERLRLFVKICHAVDYAHENFIIHRDIKPTNILVTGDGSAKLLDFGIAKILNPELAADSIDPTATAMRMMTPEYASPEQVRGEAVTKTSDIYSLGVLLYELLTGHRPYRLKNRALHEIARVICEEEPDVLAASLTREENFVPTSTNEEKTTLEAVFESRSASRESLKRELSGDVERVVFKALRKDPDERYQSARELAEDIERYLDGKPVLAPAHFPNKTVFTKTWQRANPDEISVAVLPFKLFGAAGEDTGDEYLCIGLADALITRLSNVARFIIRPTSSVLRYGSRDTEPITAGAELGVNYLVDGNIRRVGSRLRVTVQLLNIQEGAACWAEKFDEEFTDVLTLEDTISEKVAEALLPQLTGDERIKIKKRGTNSAEAFEHYLRGRYYWNSFTEDGFAKAIVAYYQAIAHDPDYALAYAGIADYHNWLGVYGVLPSKECFQSAVENARTAIELDGELGEAYASLAFAQHGGFFEWKESEENFQKSLRLNPNYAETHVWYSIKLTTEGRFNEGIRHAERAVELDPQTPFNQHNLGWILYYARQFDRSLRQYQKTAAMFPEYPLAHYGLAWVLRYLGRFEEAVSSANLAQKLLSESIFSLHVQGQTFAAAGMREQAEIVLEKLEKLAEKQFVSPYHTALIYAYLDERETALELLQQCAENSDAWLVWLGVEPAFDSLRADSRLRAVMRRTRNPMLENSLVFTEKENPTLAVLPFKVMNEGTSDSADDKFLGMGLADALITRLSNVRKFTVRPTSSVLRYDAENNPFVAGEELGVDFLIDGNIRRVGESWRVTVQLLCIEQGSTRWAKRFDEHITDFLTLEDTISEQIVAEILPQLTGEDREQLKKRGTNNPQAHEAYLRGRFFWNKFTQDAFPKAFEAFSEAVRLDPNFAQAHVGIADFYIWLCIFGGLPSMEAFPKAKEAASRALEIDPNLGEAHATLAFATTVYDWDWERAEMLFRRAIELAPNYSHAHEWYSNLLVATGRSEEAVEASARSVELNPMSARTIVMNGWLLYQTRHFRRSIAEAEKAVEMEKDFPQGLMHLGNALDKAGRGDEAVHALRESLKFWKESPLARSLLCHALVNAGREAEARAVLNEILFEAESRPLKPYFIAVAYAAFDERDAAFRWLERAFEERNEWLIWLGTEPKFDSLREDPRYFSLLERMNNPIAKEQRTEAGLAGEAATTIAVLPLKTLQIGKTGNTEEEFLGIGLADALVTRLSSVKRLIVRPTNSVIRSGKNTSDPFVIANEINAAFIVDGHVKRVGDRIRVSVQLLNAAEQTAVWAKSFDEKYTDVLTLEDTVSEQIAAALLPQLTEDEKANLGKRPTDNAKAFEAYIRGRYHWNSFTEEGLQKSLLAYREALEHDPNFALAYAGIADYYNFLCIFGSKSPLLSFPAAKEAAQKAIELNPNLAEAYVALGVTAFGYDWNFAEGERLFKKALELNPNYSVAHFWQALAYGLKGDHENAIREMRRAETLSPGIPSLIVIFAFVYRNARKFDQALEKIRQALSIQPNYYVGVQGFGWVVKWTKNYDEAEEITRRSVEQTKRLSLPLYAYAYVLAVRGKADEARKIARELEERRAQKYIPAIYLVLIYTELGDFDAAFKWLDASFDEREFWAIWLPVDPRLDALKKDARYNDFLKRIRPPGAEEDIHQSHVATRILPPLEAQTSLRPPATSDAAPPEEKTAPAAPEKSRKRFWIAGAAVVLLGILGFLGFQSIKRLDNGGYQVTFGTPAAPNVKIPVTPDIKTIAVLPFETDQDFENEESFGVGLAEAVSQKLRQVKELSMGLVFLKLRNKASLEELAGDYAATYVLRGRLHIEGDRLKVDAELVGTADGKVIWLEKFDESRSNFQNLQTTISERVLKALTVELSANERQQLAKNYTENSEAYQLYLVGRFQLSKRSGENLQNAIKTFEKVRRLDPNFALAYAGLADAYSLLVLYQIPPPPDAYDRAKQYALKAVELDPNLAEAHASLGYVLFYGEQRRAEGIAELKRAVELNPSYSTAYHWLAMMLSLTGSHDEAIATIKKAFELEPKSAIIQTATGLIYLYARRYDEALASADKVLETNEGFVPAYKTKRMIYSATGNYSAALSAYRNERIYSENTDEDDEGWLMIAAQVQAVGGLREESLANLKRTSASALVRNNSIGFAYEIAVAYALLGEADSAIEWLKKAKDVNSYGVNIASVDPRLDKIRGDARFAELINGTPSS